ncbi:MAG: hypothetical protein QOF62_1869 [Pyrinomonadaceae bacterium]|jgi:hypothetical protein|nr:hypothetical protein [Pyrinomonadaceae bacterium]
MSEVKLNLVDAERVLHGTIHGSFVDACVAALSAEPETIAELEVALARYHKLRDAENHFAWFSSIYLPTNTSSTNFGLAPDNPEPVHSLAAALDAEPWDAGIVVIDLAARIVAIDSLYSQPGPEGEVFFHDGQALTDIPILYRVPDDWLFVNSVDAYRWSRERRIRERAVKPACDLRPILFGRPLLEFIVNAYFSLPVERRTTLISPADVETDNNEAADEPLASEISAIHARWLLTPRADLRGESPRDVLLAQQDFIEFDLHTRSLQWSLQNEGPPCLSKDSFAYRFAGFGMHEWILYYDLVRHLLQSLFDLQSTADVRNAESVNEILATLEQIETEWLESPQPDLDGRIPAILIDNERKRLPQALRPRDMIIDEDCPACQMFGDETSPLGMGVGFWHLDGCNMDDDFAFSSFKTRQEWEVENRRREEFNREFNRKWAEREQRIARGEPLEPDPFFDPEPFDFEAG